MRINPKLLLFLISLISLTIFIASKTIVSKVTIPFYNHDLQKKYKLVWHDEFNYIGRPNPQKWDFESGFVRNKELQWYQAKNAYVNGKSLLITAKMETIVNPNYVPLSENWKNNRKQAQYTSASLTTAQRFHFKYGKAEIRAKISTQKNSWPAFWAMGTKNLNKPNPVPFEVLGEIDILEYYNNNLYANFFWEGEKNLDQSVKKYNINQFDSSIDWNQFHIWTLIKNKDKIQIVLDHTYLLNEMNISEIKNFHHGNNPFQEEFYFILNLALKDKKGHLTYPKQNENIYFEIDYVRVYESTDN